MPTWDRLKATLHSSAPLTLASSAPEVIGACLSEDDVLDFAGCAALDPARRGRLEAHVDSCPNCFDLVSHWVRDSRSVPALDSSSHAAFATMFRRGAMVGGRYRIQRFIARGGMGEVYEARDTKLSETVALKTVVSTASDSHRAARKLFDEVQLARRIQHANVCRIHELHEHTAEREPDETLHFLTMEFIDGERLGDYVRREGSIPIARCSEIVRQILNGLQAAHSAHVLHLDLKTDNIMLRRRKTDINEAAPEAVIMDFGLSRAFESEARLRTSEQGQLIGSLAYMAPEQIECSRTLSRATDIYALGVVVYELLTGRLPFLASSAPAMLHKILEQRPGPPSRVRADVPRAFDAFVLRCLSRDPSQRFQSVESARAALELALSGERKPRRARWLAGFVILLIAVSAALWQRRPRSAHERAPHASELPAHRETVPASSAVGGTDPRDQAAPAATVSSPSPAQGEQHPAASPVPLAPPSQPSKRRTAKRRESVTDEAHAEPARDASTQPSKPGLPGAPAKLSW